MIVEGHRSTGGGAEELQSEPHVLLFRGDVAWRSFDVPHRHAVSPAGGTPARPEYRWLAPGPYTLVARAAGHMTVERRLDVGVDGPGEVVLTLLREEDLDGVIEGRVTSLTGGYAPPLEVLATELDPLEVAARGRGRVAWKEENGALVGHFRIEGLPARAHRLQLLTADEFGNPTRLVDATEPAGPLAEPGVPVAIVVRDDVPESDLIVRLEDERSGTPIEAFTVTLFVPDASLPPVRAQTFDGAARLTRVLAPARREVLLVAKGHRPRRLPAGTLDPAETEVTFTVRPGWGAFVVALGPEGPLPGATVLVDGVEAAVTGPDGLALLEQDLPPEWIDVRHAEWALDAGPETDEEGRLVARERRSGASLMFRFGPR